MAFEDPKDTSFKELFPEEDWAGVNSEDDKFTRAWAILEGTNAEFEDFLASKGYGPDDLPTEEIANAYWIEYINSIAGLATKRMREEDEN